MDAKNPAGLYVVFCQAAQLPIEVFETLGLDPTTLVRLPLSADGHPCYVEVADAWTTEEVAYGEAIDEIAVFGGGIQFRDARTGRDVVGRRIPDASR